MYTFLVVCLHKMYTTLQIFVLAKALEDKTPPPLLIQIEYSRICMFLLNCLFVFLT